MTTSYLTLLQEFLPRPIASASAYRRTLKQIDGLMRKGRRSRAEDDLLELLATLAEQYEFRQGYATPKLSPRERLAGLMEARELSQAELSRGSGVPRTTINEILAGRRGVSKTNALRLARFFEAPPEEFLAE
jgi:HTH-type transcriptional regulator / antitoxin HigA